MDVSPVPAPARGEVPLQFRQAGLEGLPDAVACARYHVLSNSMGGVPVEYMEESDRKAWVRFRYPRWMYDGPTLCGVPVEASRGFLKGWYAQNGVSLKNPRLGFVCVSEDMTGQFGLCGYFMEHDHDLSAEERLRFAPDERPRPSTPPPSPPRPMTSGTTCDWRRRTGTTPSNISATASANWSAASVVTAPWNWRKPPRG